MSVTLSRYDRNDTTKSGYFRIGFVTLQIPPEDILTNRVVNNDKVTPLRAGNEMQVKSGQARWDITVRWVALSDPEVGDYTQWEQVRDVLAMFKAAPFVEIESPHIRQVFAKKDRAMATARLAMALRQLRVETHPDIVDGLSITLTMSLFNFHPYSTDFGYIGDNGASVSADDSSLFQQYIQTWKDANLACKQQAYQDPVTQYWGNQEPGVMRILWRQYLPVIDGQPPDFSSTVGVTGAGTIAVSGGYDSVIVSSAAAAGVDPALIKGIMQKESQFQVDAIGISQLITDQGLSSAQTVQIANDLRKRIKSDADGGAAAVSGFHSKYGFSPDLGLMQINYGFNGKGHRPIDFFDPQINISTGVSVVRSIFDHNLTENEIDAYNVGVGGVTGKNKSKTVKRNIPYRDEVLRNKAKWAVAGPTKPAPPVAQQSAQDKADQVAADNTFTNLVQDGWIFDHRTDGVTFFYKNMPELADSNEGGMTLQDATHGDNEYSLYPSAFSVLFINNLAQLPLAGYQYPTYQHIGPASTNVSISFASVGIDPDVPGDEYEHPGMVELTTMSHALEEQFRRLRTSFRRVSSVHRMQAVFVEHQVLNMLGIHSIMLDQLNTETVKESSNLVQVSLIGTQYENVYEDSGPYKINGVGQYRQTLNTILNNENPTFTPQEQKGIPDIAQYLKDKESNDWEALARRFLNVAKTHNQILESFSTIGSVPLPNGTFTVLLEGAPSLGVNGEQLPNTDEQTMTYRDFLLKFSSETNDPDFPALVARAQKLQASGGVLSWMDYLLLSRSLNNHPESASVQRNVEAGLTAQQKADWTRQAFTAATDVLLQFDPSFQSQVQKLVASPKFKGRFINAVSPTDPSTSNKNHGAYRDLGLNAATLAGRDFNPGMYFINHNDEYTDIVHRELEQTINATAKTTAAVNKATPNSGVTVSTSTLIPGDADSVMRATNIPGYNMAEAFPTYKMFFMEEDNLGLFFSFDNFFSYSSVLDFEILKPKDKPATAIIQISNIAHLLNNKLFDDTLAGAYERQLERFGKELPADSSGEAVSNTAGDERIILGGKTISGEPYMLGPDNREGYPGRKKRVPLKYFPLQTGTKIQIRFGFSNNPDDLTAVFTGKITEISDLKSDVVTITAQSYLLDLMTVSVDKANTDSWWKLRGDLRLAKGPAYGGITIFGDSGSTDSVIENLLKNSAAYHFGHWQVATPTSPDFLLKGFTWSEMSGKLLSRLASTGSLLSKAGDFLQANFDRSGENIMINQYISFDGSQVGSRLKRDYLDQQGTNMLTPVEYYVDSQLNMSLWEIMRDVARRYPEFTLCEKQYGFPYGAEASMVFAHPLDWYYARWPLIGDSELLRAADKDNQLYSKWWSQQGKQIFQDAVKLSLKAGNSPLTIIPSSVFDTAATGPSGLTDALATVFQIRLNLFGVTADKNSLLGQDLANDLLSLPSQIGATIFASSRDDLERARKVLNSVQKAYQVYVAQNSKVGQDLLKPVRRYHFIDHQSIIHNGMSMNDKIFNAVRITDKVIFANQNIPAQHTRMLDVTHLINDPKQNVMDPGLEVAYGQSFLKEELGKMYGGEIVLRGIPEIEPYDVLMMMDPSTGIVGPVEVDQVIHSFNMENGYITIVKPRAIVAVNEAASAGLNRGLLNAMYAGIAELNSLFTGQADTKATVAVAGAAAGGIGATAGAVALFGTPPGWAILALGAISAGAATLWWTGKQSSQNTMLLQPVTRFGRPWLGGLQGFLVTDFLGSVTTSIHQFLADEIYPTLDAYRIAQGIHDDFLDDQSLVPAK